jgi:hypothetical protein
MPLSVKHFENASWSGDAVGSEVCDDEHATVPPMSAVARKPSAAARMR